MFTSRFFGAVLSLSSAFLLLAKDDPFEKLDWKTLIANTRTEPIVVKPGSLSEAQVAEQHYAWLKRKLIDPELERLKGTPEEAKLKPLVEFLGLFTAGLNPFGVPKEIREQATAFVQGGERRLTVDFLCAHILEAYSYKDSMLGFELVCKAPALPGFPEVFRVYAQARMLSYANNVDKDKANSAQKEYYDVLVPFLQSKLSDETAQWSVLWLLRDQTQEVRWNREPRHIDLFMKSKLPEWARLTLAGVTHYKWGWNAGGRGFGIPKPNGTAIMAQQLKEARTKLTKAWELMPSIPYAATTMLRVAGVGDLQEGETLRLWLDRATAAVFDSKFAHSEFLAMSTPYWRGSFSELMAFGKVCADTKRYDSELPTVFNACVHKVGNAVEDWAQLYRNPEIAKLLLETRRNHAAKCIGTPQEMQQFSYLFVECWLCRDYEGAGKALERLAFEDDFRISKLVFTMLDTLNLNLAFVLRDAILRGGKGSADYQKGVEAFKNGEYAEALTRYQAVQPFTTPLSDRLLKANIRLTNFQQQFSKGEWTQMPLDEWYCWLDLDGEASVVNKSHRMRLQSDWEFSKVLFRGKLGTQECGEPAHSPKALNLA